MIQQASDRVFVALDSTRLDDLVASTRELKWAVGGIKIGKEFFTACGPAGVRELLKELERYCYMSPALRLYYFRAFDSVFATGTATTKPYITLRETLRLYKVFRRNLEAKHDP